MPKIIIGIIVIALVAYAGYYFMNNKFSSMMPQENRMMTEESQMELLGSSEEAADENTVALNEQNSSGEMGTATFMEIDGKTTVRLEMKGYTPGVSQPAHIHVGSCPDVGAVTYPLTNVVDGMSETVLDVTISELASKQPLGINVHKSAAEANIYTACGDLNLSGSSAMMDR